MHHHALRDLGLRVEAAEGDDPDEAVVVHMGDEEAQFVHVRGQHHARPAAAPPDRDDVAKRVDGDLISDPPDLLDDHLPYALLATGGTGCLAQAPQQVQIDVVGGHHSTIHIVRK